MAQVRPMAPSSSREDQHQRQRKAPDDHLPAPAARRFHPLPARRAVRCRRPDTAAANSMRAVHQAHWAQDPARASVMARNRAPAAMQRSRSCCARASVPPMSVARHGQCTRPGTASADTSRMISRIALVAGRMQDADPESKGSLHRRRCGKDARRQMPGQQDDRDPQPQKVDAVAIDAGNDMVDQRDGGGDGGKADAHPAQHAISSWKENQGQR